MKKELEEANITALRMSSREVVRELGLLNGQSPRPFGLSGCHALIEIERHGLLTLTELAGLLRLDKSTTSRLADRLTRSGYTRVEADTRDRRRKPLALTKKGRLAMARLNRQAGQLVESALALIRPDERVRVQEGMAHYAKALARRRRQMQYTVRPIRKSDDVEMGRIIRIIMSEFPELAGLNDPEIDAMSKAYRGAGSAYFVLGGSKGIVGGAGIAPLKGSSDRVCELRKMYLAPEVRGLGLGKKLVETCLRIAGIKGYRACYLETLTRMDRARRLYESMGFQRRQAQRADACASRCNTWYELAL